MATKSDVVVCDVLHKNENKRVDMIDIMMSTQDYLGKDFKHTVASGGDLLTETSCTPGIVSSQLRRIGMPS